MNLTEAIGSLMSLVAYERLERRGVPPSRLGAEVGDEINTRLVERKIQIEHRAAVYTSAMIEKMGDDDVGLLTMFATYAVAAVEVADDWYLKHGS